MMNEIKHTLPTLQQRLAQREKPNAKPIMFQKWRDLLFLHWTFDPEQIQRTVPEGLIVDTFEGKAYVGIVPFFMRDVRPRFLPAVPGISNFMETNLRTYVFDDQGIPGVWFYSLDANQMLAVEMAKLLTGLPYFHASMQSRRDGSGEIEYRLQRYGPRKAVECVYHYRGEGSSQPAEPGTLDFFLAERYVLFSLRGGKIFKGMVHHSPYPLQKARASRWDENLFLLDGLEPPGRAPEHTSFSSGVDVEVYF